MSHMYMDTCATGLGGCLKLFLDVVEEEEEEEKYDDHSGNCH